MSLEERKAAIAAKEAELFQSVCTESIFDRARDMLTMHIRIALRGMSDRLIQYKASVEALRG